MASQNGLYYPRGIKVFFLPKAAAKAEVLLFSTVNKIMPTGVETRARKAIYEMHTSITSKEVYNYFCATEKVQNVQASFDY